MQALIIAILLFINGCSLIPFLKKERSCSYFRLNESASLPFYLFLSSPLKNIERGIYVSFSHPFVEKDVFKQIVGLPGDQIKVVEEHIFVNGKEYGRIYQVSPLGISLSPISEGFIPEGFVFVHGSHPKSFDSRYAEFGLIANEQLKEQLWPIF